MKSLILLKKPINQQSGQSLLELLIAIALISILLLYVLDGIFNVFHSQVRSDHKLEALQLAIEGMEVAYNFSQNAQWNEVEQFVSSGKYAVINLETPQYQFTESDSEQTVSNIYTRDLRLFAVRRDSSGEISSDPADPTDNDTVEVVSTVKWQEGSKTRQVTYTTYVIH